MDHPFWRILLVIGIIAIQTLSGYIGNKQLGFITPIIFIVFVLYLLFSGNLPFSLIDVLLPLVGLFCLAGLWENGNKIRTKKENQELEKLEAQDLLKK